MQHIQQQRYVVGGANGNDRLLRRLRKPSYRIRLVQRRDDDVGAGNGRADRIGRSGDVDCLDIRRGHSLDFVHVEETRAHFAFEKKIFQLLLARLPEQLHIRESGQQHVFRIITGFVSILNRLLDKAEVAVLLLELLDFRIAGDLRAAAFLDDEKSFFLQLRIDPLDRIAVNRQLICELVRGRQRITGLQQVFADQPFDLFFNLHVDRQR